MQEFVGEVNKSGTWRCRVKQMQMVVQGPLCANDTRSQPPIRLSIGASLPKQRQETTNQRSRTGVGKTTTRSLRGGLNTAEHKIFDDMNFSCLTVPID